MRIDRIELQRVHYMPKELRPGVLYVSAEFGAAAHLCACGCGAKVRTPIGPTDWEFEEGPNGPTLRPSVGNWQFPCQSHYWIWDGEIHWSDPWTPSQIAAGQRAEQERARAYYEAREQRRVGLLWRFWRWFRGRLGF